MTRAEFNEAFREVIMTEFVDVPCEEQISFVFSEKFELKMKKLVAYQKKAYWKYMNTTKKRVSIAVIFLLSFFMLAMSSEDIRVSMLQWCENVYEEYIHYYFEGETTKIIEHEYQLMVIPEGFEKVYEQHDEERYIIEYENMLGECISLYQHVSNEFETYVDNENGHWSTIIINNNEVRFFDYSTQMGAIWTEDGYYMLLIYYGCDDMEIIKEMVENLK